MKKYLFLFQLIQIIIINLIKCNSEYNVFNDDQICLTCPAIKNSTTFNMDLLFWYAEEKDLNAPKLWFCDDTYKNKKIYKNNNETLQIKYGCLSTDLCLYSFKSYYPVNFACIYGSATEKIDVKFYAPLSYLKMKIDSDNFNYKDDTLIVRENKNVHVTCELQETTPPSTVRVTLNQIGDANKRNLIIIKENKFERVVNQHFTIVTYFYTFLANRSMQGMILQCEAKMNSITPEIAAKLKIQPELIKPYKLDVTYLPVCGKKGSTFNTGIGQEIIIDCSVSDSNPSVTSYTYTGPSDNTKVEAYGSLTSGQFKVIPKDVKDFGKYECFPRNEAGTTRCGLTLILGGYPNPPENCRISYTRNTENKTFGLITCTMGFNQGGARLDFHVYAKLPNGTLQFSGTQFLVGEKEINYLTKEIDESKYYEFVVNQANNYGNSSAVQLSIGSKNEEKPSQYSTKTIIIIACSSVGGCLLLCICCCCLSNCCSSNSSKSNTLTKKYCPCCYDEVEKRGDESSYMKAPYPGTETKNECEEDNCEKKSEYDNFIPDKDDSKNIN